MHSQPNLFEFSEADTYRKYVTPAIQAAGWGIAPLRLQNGAVSPMDILTCVRKVYLFQCTVSENRNKYA